MGFGVSLTHPCGLQVGSVVLQRKIRGLLLEKGDMDSREGKNSSAHKRDDDFLEVTCWVSGQDPQHWCQWSSCATEAETIKLHFPGCMQLGFWVQIKFYPLHAVLRALKSGREVEITPYSWDEIANVRFSGSRMLRGNCGDRSGRIPHVSVQVGLVAAAFWSQLSGIWIMARAACPGTPLSWGSQREWLPGSVLGMFEKASLEPAPPTLPGGRHRLTFVLDPFYC